MKSALCSHLIRSPCRLIASAGAKSLTHHCPRALLRTSLYSMPDHTTLRPIATKPRPKSRLASYYWTRISRAKLSFWFFDHTGGSNSPRTRLWRLELQKLANETGLIIELCHYPPGTSKWNKIEHKLFCHITRNWQGVPLETIEIVVNLISSTKTSTGLEVHAWIDKKTYAKAKPISEVALSEVKIVRNKFHGEWNYEIHPNGL